MDLTGSYDIPATREAVWHGLNDAETLKRCIPGCQSLEKLSETELQAQAQLKIGPMKASFSGKVLLSDLDPPNSYRISGEGNGGVAGFAKGGALVTLTDAPEGGTRLTYEAKAEIGGKLAQLGSRLIDGVAKKMADDFFKAFADSFAPAIEEVAAETPKKSIMSRLLGG